MNREKAIRNEKPDNNKLVYRGVKIIVRLIRRVKKRLAVSVMFHKWKTFSLFRSHVQSSSQVATSHETYLSAALDFRNSILLSKAMQTFIIMTQANQSQRKQFIQIRNQLQIRTKLKVIYGLHLNVLHIKHYQTLKCKATTYWACRLEKECILKWKQLISNKKVNN